MNVPINVPFAFHRLHSVSANMPRIARASTSLFLSTRPVHRSPARLRIIAPHQAVSSGSGSTSSSAQLATASSAVWKCCTQPSRLSTLPSFLSRKSPALPFLTPTRYRLHPPSISLSQSLQQQQSRSVTYGSEYQPSQRIRKRRHGFLARRRSRTGRRILVRRRMKGRRFLSH